MNKTVEEIANKVVEGFQSASIKHGFKESNLFYRNVSTHESQDLSFITGLVSTGLRGCAELSADNIVTNYNQLVFAKRQHYPLVVQTSSNIDERDGYSVLSSFENIEAIQGLGCPQFIASNPTNHLYLSLIAHRVAELCLSPVIVIKDYKDAGESLKELDNNQITQYLGASDEQIDSPTPSQEIVFGPKRRRIPNWFSVDTPLMLGSHKEKKALDFENAAEQMYFDSHTQELIEQAFAEFKSIFGIEISFVQSTGNGESALLSIGSSILNATAQSTKGNGVSSVNIIQLYPFPTIQLSELLKGKKAITVFDYVGNSLLESKVLKLNNSAVNYVVKHGVDVNPMAIDKSIDHMLSGQEKKKYFLDVAFTKNKSDYPKHDILLSEINKAYTNIQENSVLSEKSGDKNIDGNTNSILPTAIRQYQDHGPKYSHLSRFYDDTGFFYQNNETEEIVADPFSAIPVIPSATAYFHNTDSDKIPSFKSENCTACGDCFIQCPHSAIPPISIGVERLVKAGADIAVNKGASISKLTPMMKNFAKVAGKAMDGKEIFNAADCLDASFESLKVQMKLEGDKLEAITSEYNTVRDIVKDFPVAITDAVFNNPNTIEAGTGELFSLAVNPAACTGCGICSEVCSEDALPMIEKTAQVLSESMGQFNLWEQLPDTSGDTINRLYKDDNYSSLAAMMLSRSYYMTMTNANVSEKDAPYKSLVHLITASTESLVQPKLIEKIKKIEELIEGLTNNIHGKLSASLPKENLEELSKSLKGSIGRKLSIKDVVNRISDNDQGKLIDTSELSRKTDLVEMLKQLDWVLAEGPSGVGRSRFGMVISGSDSLSWAKEYPYNNFTSPIVVHWKGSAPEQLMGLFKGQLRYFIDNIKILRRAELEIKDKYDPSIHDQELISLGWDDLTDEEKELIPPFILIAERSDLNDLGWNSLNKILAGKFPIKVFLLDNATTGKNADYLADLAQTTSGLFSTIALKTAYVYQGSMGNMDHLSDGLLDGIGSSSPALFNLYATKRNKHITTDVDWMPLASLALNSRALPALRYNPSEKEGFLSGGISLGGNRDKENDWFKEEVKLGDEDESFEYTITWADWAFTQNDWNAEFTVISKNEENLLLAEYITLDTKARKGKNPVIARGGDKGLQYYLVSEKVVSMTEAVLSNWNTLQEVAGLLVEFPTKLRDNVESELSKKYESDLSELKAKHQEDLQEQERNQTEIIRQKLKDKLVALTAMAQQNSSN